ncbi:Vitamin B12 ABC transporter, B12-binding component BtuF [Desulfurella amilsii]|uniref:Vitamin B12 ABC transporter, B12-binding component BtuF n=1 Tax=Desulfurella amilsii TaxID=1562698 RepID=A0A1X4XVX7_9BACT|nr:helical backbone metal receptor [Desulfurella amilsii]OSS41690.1 Vitamin B12 ABC transporter, B12-binding component BtuF [Desulfurella amilsii]
MKRSIIAVVFLFTFVSNAFALTIKDDANRIVNISKVSSIVVLSPAACDILEEIGASSFIVGYTDYAKKPNPKAVNVGAFGTFNIEQIIALKPELVIMPKFIYERYGISSLSALGIKVFVFEPKNIEGIVKDVEKIGLITGKIGQAKNKIRNFNAELSELHHIKQKPSVVFLVWLSPIIVAGNDTFISNAISVAGGQNIIKKNGWPEVTSEYLIKKNPMFLIVNSRLKNDFFKQNKLLGYFYKKHKVLFIDNTLIERPSLDIIKGIKILNNYFYENCNNNSGW